MKDVNSYAYNNPVKNYLGTHEDLGAADTRMGSAPYTVSPSQALRDNIQTQINDSAGIMSRNEGVASGSEAANALFNNNTTTMSRALSNRANKRMALNRSENELSGTLKNYGRSREALGNVGNKVQTLEKLRQHNFAGQLKFADELANYNEKLETAKIGAIGSILGGIAGGAMKLATGGA